MCKELELNLFNNIWINSFLFSYKKNLYYKLFIEKLTILILNVALNKREFKKISVQRKNQF